MTLSLLAVLLGLAYGLPQLYGLRSPAGYRERLRRFPRSEGLGYVLMVWATAWFLWNLQRENISDFAPYKPAMMIGFGAVGVGACFFVRDYLAVRGLAVLLLCLAKVIVDVGRLAPSDWRWVIVGWAYVLVVAGIWFTVSPCRFRDWIEWNTQTDARVRVGCGARLGFGMLLAGLGMTVY